MIPFQERKKLRRILYSKVTLIILVVILFAVSEGAWHIYQKAVIARSERDIVAHSLTDLQFRSNELESSLSRLKSGHGVEEEVRQKYTVARQGEEVVIIIDENAKKGDNIITPSNRSFWGNIVLFFTKK